MIFLANPTALSSASYFTQFPELENITNDDRLLVFVMTVTGVAIGITLIDENVSESDFRKFSYTISDELKKWNFQGYNPFGQESAYKAYVDLANFIKGKESED